jgi:hypothetical protein
MNYYVLWYEPKGFDAHIEYSIEPFFSKEDAEKFAEELKNKRFVFKYKILETIKTEIWSLK